MSTEFSSPLNGITVAILKEMVRFHDVDGELRRRIVEVMKRHAHQFDATLAEFDNPKVFGVIPIGSRSVFAEKVNQILNQFCNDVDYKLALLQIITRGIFFPGQMRLYTREMRFAAAVILNKKADELSKFS